MNFDEAGRELAESYMSAPSQPEQWTRPEYQAFLAGRDSCKEALRVALDALDWCANAQHLGASRYRADMAIKLIKNEGCYVGEE